MNVIFRPWMWTVSDPLSSEAGWKSMPHELKLWPYSSAIAITHLGQSYSWSNLKQFTVILQESSGLSRVQIGELNRNMTWPTLVSPHPTHPQDIIVCLIYSQLGFQKVLAFPIIKAVVALSSETRDLMWRYFNWQV